MRIRAYIYRTKKPRTALHNHQLTFPKY